MNGIYMAGNWGLKKWQNENRSLNHVCVEHCAKDSDYFSVIMNLIGIMSAT